MRFVDSVSSWMCILLCDLSTGSFLDQKSTLFHEEFPQLASGAEGHFCSSRENDESREAHYGPGPSLRPQSMYLILQLSHILFWSLYCPVCKWEVHVFRFADNVLLLITSPCNSRWGNAFDCLCLHFVTMIITMRVCWQCHDKTVADIIIKFSE